MCWQWQDRFDGDGRSASDRRPETRVSDDDRHAVIEELQRHTADGRLTLDEFEERVDEVLQARTAADLKVTTRDLPAAPGVGRNPARRPRDVVGRHAQHAGPLGQRPDRTRDVPDPNHARARAIPHDDLAAAVARRRGRLRLQRRRSGPRVTRRNLARMRRGHADRTREQRGHEHRKQAGAERSQSQRPSGAGEGLGPVSVRTT